MRENTFKHPWPGEVIEHTAISEAVYEVHTPTEEYHEEQSTHHQVFRPTPQKDEITKDCYGPNKNNSTWERQAPPYAAIASEVTTLKPEEAKTKVQKRE